MLNKFYENLLGLDGNWAVDGVDQDNEKMEVHVKIVHRDGGECLCPKCGKTAAYHDMRDRFIRHLDSCEHKTFLAVRYPRIRCPRCGIQAIVPPFADASSRFSKAFEWRVIELSRSATVQKVAKDLKISWHAVERIKMRGVNRGVKRQYQKPGRKIKNLAIDEVSFQKHHNYSTIITDADRGHVIAVLHDRTAETLINWFQTQRVADFSELQSIRMDMAPPYILAVMAFFPNADKLICFDRFHVAQLFNRALDVVRRMEWAFFNRGKGRENNPLTGTRFEWLRNSGRMDNRTERRRKFLALTRRPLLTVRAWELKEEAARLWEYERDGCAAKAWDGLIGRLRDSGIKEFVKLAKTVGRHLTGILNAIRLRANNGLAEARNSCIQRIKRMACGFRDQTRFHREIIFQFGGLSMAF